MRPQVKLHITRLAIRAILSVISGSSPVTAATNEPVRSEAGPVSGAPTRTTDLDLSRTKHCIIRITMYHQQQAAP
jgi:hypothetical protein